MIEKAPPQTKHRRFHRCDKTEGRSDTEAFPEIERYTFSFGSMKVRQIVGKALISSSFDARRSLRNQITFSFRSALASSGRARKPSEKRVVIMQTATLSTTSHTRSIGDCFVTARPSTWLVLLMPIIVDRECLRRYTLARALQTRSSGGPRKSVRRRWTHAPQYVGAP